MNITDHPVLSFARQFTTHIFDSVEVQRFRQAEEQLEKSHTVQNYIDTIKKKQKELVHAKHYQKTKYITLLEEELETLNHELNQLPIVCEYQQSQVDVNELLQMIQHVLADAISTELVVERGGEILSGCGNNGACGCSK